MNKTVEEGRAFGRNLVRRLEEAGDSPPTLVICPTFLGLWGLARELASSGVLCGGQNLDLGREGAFTGAVSGYLLREAGARFVIVGHSERRSLFGESDALCAQKAAQAHQAHLRPIFCVGESAEEYRAGMTDDVITRQVRALFGSLDAGLAQQLVIAYEPVWAIGSGQVPEPSQVGAVARLIRRVLGEREPGAGAVPVLYGGSVSEKNIGAFMGEKDIDGALVGGASLHVDQFLAMAASAR